MRQNWRTSLDRDDASLENAFSMKVLQNTERNKEWGWGAEEACLGLGNCSDMSLVKEYPPGSSHKNVNVFLL